MSKLIKPVGIRLLTLANCASDGDFLLNLSSPESDNLYIAKLKKLDVDRMSEQRKQARVNVDRAIVIKLSNGDSIKARMINLSIGGLAIRYPAAGETGAELGLLFQITAPQETVTINTKGVVRHSHVHHQDFITGIEFIALTEQDAKHIANFINSKLGSRQPSGFVVSHRHQS